MTRTRLAGRVLTENDQPAVGAVVTISTSKGNKTVAHVETCDSTGSFQSAISLDDEYLVVARWSSGGHSHSVSAAQRICGVSECTIRLQTGGQIYGSVTLAEHPVERFGIVLSAEAISLEGSVVEISDINGHFVLDHVNPGTWWLNFKTLSANVACQEVDVENGLAISLGEIALVSGRTIFGTVSKYKADAVSSAVVTIAHSIDIAEGKTPLGKAFSSRLSATTDRDGFYKIESVEPYPGAVRPLAIWASHPVEGVSPMSELSSTESRHDLELLPVGHLDVAISGTKIGQITVTAVRDGEPPGVRVSRSGSDSVVIFKNVPVGHYTVEARTNSLIQSKNCDVYDGRVARLTLDVTDKLSKVRVVVAHALPHAQAVLRLTTDEMVVSRPRVKSRIGSHAHFVFDDVVAGTYRLSVSGKPEVLVMVESQTAQTVTVE